ncbi:MAG: FHA domain-containing protein [Dehalococcoidia bacterium]|jgi:hypothetical protein
MKKILMPLLILTLICTSAVSIVSPVLAQAEATPPMSPDDTWQPPYDGGTSLEPSVGVETYGQNWPAMQIPIPSPVEPGIPSSITNAYLVNSYGQLLTNLYSTQQVYLIVSFNGPGYFYLWEYYPSGSSPYGHWLCYRWYRPGAGVWRVGPFAAQQWDSSGRYYWKMWFISGFTWSTRTLSFNYTRGYYPNDIPSPTPTSVADPVINSFNASLSSLELGQTATLTWTTSNASSATISPGVGTVGSSGATTVTPSATTVYTLTATGNSGNPVSSSLTITVMPRVAPTLGADQATIQSGQYATLSWNAPSATQVYISGVGNYSSSGSARVSPENTTTYNLTATYIDGTTQSASATVDVQHPPFLLWGLIALLAVAAVAIAVLLARKPAKVATSQASVTRAASTSSVGATMPAGTAPAVTSVVEIPPAKLSMPDGSEILLAGNSRSFGRHDFNKFLPEDSVSYISRQHINIWYENDQYYIEDRSSTNGTRINGTEIKGAGRHALEDGDTIDLADKLKINFKK